MAIVSGGSGCYNRFVITLALSVAGLCTTSWSSGMAFAKTVLSESMAEWGGTDSLKRIKLASHIIFLNFVVPLG